MGNGNWYTDVFADKTAKTKASGRDPFGHSDDVLSGRAARAVHDSLNPYGAHRESRDSDEHPASKAVTVLFDVTGSMGHIPRILQTKLPVLMTLLSDGNYMPDSDPQVMFGAIGDATCDEFPLQIGQWESDNRLDDNLAQIILEGGGGGQQTESYELAMYFMARHTSMDCWEKRGDKGYLFIIGDEMAYNKVSPRHVRKFVGQELGEAVTTQAVVAELQRRFHLFYILPTGASNGRDTGILKYWQQLLGAQSVLQLDDPAAVAETIALTIGQMEEAIDLSRGVKDLEEMGVDTATVKSASRAVAVLESRSPATINGSLDDFGGEGDVPPPPARRI